MSREVDPFRVSELVAHEIQPAFAAEADSKKAYHLMQGYASVNDIVRCIERHGGIHLFIHQSEGDSLITNEGLVVGFCVGDSLNIREPVIHGEEEFVHIPLFI